MATIKLRKFALEIAKGTNPAEAVLKAGYNVKSIDNAYSIASQNMKRETVLKMLDHEGLTEGRITETLAETLQANKSYFVGKEAREEIRPDYLIRLKTAELALKLWGLLGTNQTQVPQLPPEIKVQFIKVDGHTKKKTILKTI